MPDFSLERRFGAGCGRKVIGLDEVGRGPWAGPVVAAAVWLDPLKAPADLLESLDDSKKLSAARRQELAAAMAGAPGLRWALGTASVAEIDSRNILAASLLAMRRAADALDMKADFALVDGNREPQLDCPSITVVKGDGISLSIAAASILAKVDRDRTMAKLADEFPGYGWERNAGYGTASTAPRWIDLGRPPTTECPSSP